MKGDPQILEALADILAAELSAINQYFLHSKMCGNWGYKRLEAKKRAESIEEMKDAEAIMDRILYLDGIPNMMRLNPVKVGEDAIEQHELDRALEVSAASDEQGIALCVARAPRTREGSRRTQWRGRSVDWLETQLHVVKRSARNATSPAD